MPTKDEMLEMSPYLGKALKEPITTANDIYAYLNETTAEERVEAAFIAADLMTTMQEQGISYELAAQVFMIGAASAVAEQLHYQENKEKSA